MGVRDTQELLLVMAGATASTPKAQLLVVVAAAAAVKPATEAALVDLVA